MVNRMSLLKTDALTHWIDQVWSAKYSQYSWQTLELFQATTNPVVLETIERERTTFQGYTFDGSVAEYCPEAPHLVSSFGLHRGAYRLQFRHVETEAVFEVLVVSAPCQDDGFHAVDLAVVPAPQLAVWQAFFAEYLKVNARLHAGVHVHVIGGQIGGFNPTVALEDIILPEQLKSDILRDVERFFRKGVGVYTRLKLKPFRKLLFAGVPGTGKSMLCNGLAKWALAQGYGVIYVSSADCQGPDFNKIDQAMRMAEHSAYPTLILLEEMDAYLHKKQKAMMLNMLDGSEGRMNPHGTLLIATTNYPEAIDSRVLKRPGRLDRIFIVPPLTDADEAERMLRLYLGDEWGEEHRALAPRLVGYTGAFVREVVIYALTQFIDMELDELPVELLVKSYEALQAQIEARDDLMQQNGGIVAALDAEDAEPGELEDEDEPQTCVIPAW